jgi:hypothetical protein
MFIHYQNPRGACLYTFNDNDGRKRARLILEGDDNGVGEMIELTALELRDLALGAARAAQELDLNPPGQGDPSLPRLRSFFVNETQRTELPPPRGDGDVIASGERKEIIEVPGANKIEVDRHTLPRSYWINLTP